MGDLAVVSKSDSHPYRRVLWLVVGVALVVVLTISGLVYKKHYDDQQRKAEIAAAEKRDKENYKTATTKMDESRAKRKYDDAIAIGNDYIPTAINKQNAALMTAQVATIYEQKQDCTKAIELYKKAETLATKKILAVYTGVGRCAYQVKDYKTSLEYNNKAIAIMRASGDAHLRMDIDTLERMNKFVEAKL